MSNVTSIYLTVFILIFNTHSKKYKIDTTKLKEPMLFFSGKTFNNNYVQTWLNDINNKHEEEEESEENIPVKKKVRRQ